VPLRELLEWRVGAESGIEEVGNSFQQADGGPSAPELKRELRWLLEDTVVDRP